MSTLNILVSGANGNLGKSVVHYFLEKGHRVIGLVHRHKQSVSNTNYKEYEIDLSIEDDCLHLLESLHQQNIQFDIAVLTTGGFALGDLKHTKQKELAKQYQLNFQTAYNLARPLFLEMEKRQNGKLFFIGSEPGMNTASAKGVMAYALAKSQLFQLTNIINADFEKTGVRAHVIVPSTIDTPENRAAVPDANFDLWQKPKDISKIIYAYAVDEKKSKSTIIIKEELNP